MNIFFKFRIFLETLILICLTETVTKVTCHKGKKSKSKKSKSKKVKMSRGRGATVDEDGWTTFGNKAKTNEKKEKKKAMKKEGIDTSTSEKERRSGEIEGS